jgi:hypothetical protein
VVVADGRHHVTAAASGRWRGSACAAGSGAGLSQAGPGCAGALAVPGSGLPERRKAVVPRDRSWPIATASMSAEVQVLPSRVS